MVIQLMTILFTVPLAVFVSCGSPTSAADADSLSAATQQVESGAKKIGEGFSETASGIGDATVEGAALAGKTVVGAARGGARLVGRAGRNIIRGMKTASETARDRLVDFGDSVVTFLKRPF